MYFVVTDVKKKALRASCIPVSIEAKVRITGILLKVVLDDRSKMALLPILTAFLI